MKRFLTLIIALFLVSAMVPGFSAEKYDDIERFSGSDYYWGRKGSYWYFCNRDGVAFPGYRWTWDEFDRFGSASMFKELPNDRIALRFGSSIDGLWGVIDASGNIVIEPLYESIGPFADNGFVVELYGKEGVLDASGAVVLETKYDFITYHEECTLQLFGLDGKRGFMDHHGNHVIDAQYSDASTMSVWAWVCVGDKYGLIDPEGNFVFEPQFDFVQVLASEYALVQKDGKFGVAAPDGSMIWEVIYDDFSGFNNDGIATVCLDGLWGFANLSGEWTLEPRFESASNFYAEGFAIVQTGGKYGMIDKNGNYLIEPIWDEIHTSGSCPADAWKYTDEAYHAVQGEKEYYFDIAGGKIVRGGESGAWR